MPPLRRQRSSVRRIIARVIIYAALANLLYTLVTRAADLPAIARDALRCTGADCRASDDSLHFACLRLRGRRRCSRLVACFAQLRM